MARKKTSRSGSKIRRHAECVYEQLHGLYPDATCALDHENPWQLLIATILSAQCTDQRVNQVTVDLFATYPDAQSLGNADPQEVEALIRSTGFYRNKAKHIIAASAKIAESFDGRVPDQMDQLLSLPGVARKTANVVLGNAYGINAGVVVDTHVKRLANRLGWTEHSDPVKIEKDLMALFETERWTELSHLLILHGRGPCRARKPDCGHCPLESDCPQYGV